MRNRVLSQDKDNSGKLGERTVKNAISKFKEQHLGLKDSDDSPLSGFELNGGDGMTANGRKKWDEFSKWCEERNLDCEYNTKEELYQIRDELRNREKNKNKNKDSK